MSELNYYYHLNHESPITAMYLAVRKLQNISECDDIVSSLTERIEDFFLNIPEKNGAKELEDFIYYTNGLITRKDKFNGIIAKPWTPSVPIVIKPNKVQKKIYSFIYLGTFSDLWRLQLKFYAGNRIVLNKSIQLAGFLKRIEACNLVSAITKDIIGINNHDIVQFYHEIKNFFYENHDNDSLNTYLTEKQCSDINTIYQVIAPDKKQEQDDNWYRKSDIVQEVLKYKTTMQRHFIPFSFHDLEVKNKNEILYNKNKAICYSKQTVSKEEYILLEKEYSILEKECTDLLIKKLKEFYNVIYELQDENFHNLMIKLKIIEEGYRPGGVTNDEA